MCGVTLRRGLSIFMCLVACLGAGSARADHFRDPGGRWSIDIPGWQFKSADGPAVLFSTVLEKGSLLTVVYLPGVTDLETAMNVPTGAITSTLPDAGSPVETRELEVDGRPGRWVVYSGTVTENGKQTVMAGLGGAVVLDGASVALVTAMTEKQRKKWGETLLGALQSARGAPAGGSQPAPAGMTSFQSDAGTFDLPPGWRSDPEGGSAFADLENDNGARIFFVKVPPLQQTRKNAIGAARKGVLGGAPQMTPTGHGQYEFTTALGTEAVAERYQGPFTVEGREVEIYGYAVGLKSAKGFIYGVGFTFNPATKESDLEEMEEIVKSLH